MIPEYGLFALILALVMAVLQATLPLAGLAWQRSSWLSWAKPLALGQSSFLGLAFLALVYAFLSNDFSVVYVAQNSNTHLPWYYRIAAVWGAHEGSLLLWICLLNLWSTAVVFFSRSLPLTMTATVLAVLGLVSAGLLLFTLQTSSPFLRWLPQSPTQGADLNPLLQDPGLAMHPPMLYMGYVGFAVVFAFAIAALLNGRLDAAWARWVRPWTLAAWCFLTLGITLGSWWSYRELGWGGWWFWDPVENASLLPWLTGTALLHSLIVAEKRGLFKAWIILLAITVFSLSLVGTFLVRSGILVSVHAFASDPSRGVFMLKFLLLVVGGSLLLYAIRAPRLQSQASFSFLARENLLFANNLLLMVLMATVLLGTLYPLVVDALQWGKISVGPPYFNTVFLPIALPLLLLMGIAPHSRWRQTTGRWLWQRLWPSLLVTLLISAAIVWWLHLPITLATLLGLLMGVWVVCSTLQDGYFRYRSYGGLGCIPRSYYAMVVAHLGVAICALGITLSSAYHWERDVYMQPGDQVKIGDYQFQLQGFEPLQGPNYTGVAGVFDITSQGQTVSQLIAEKRVYTAQSIAMTEAAIDPGFSRDLYIALGEPLAQNAWAVRIYVKPYVRWIWAGGLLMLLGGLLAIRLKTPPLSRG